MDAGDSTLFFHAPCFDGIVSAVLAADYVEEGSGGQVERLVPASYDRKPTWLATRLPPRSIVVDFLFHPDAWFWADHHATTFAAPEARACFQEKRDPRHVYDPAAASCSGLLWRHLADLGHRNPRFGALVEWAEKTDAARYSSVEEAIQARAPALRINASLAVDGDDEYSISLVRALRTHSLDHVADFPEVAQRYERFRAETDEGLARFARGARVDPGRIVVFDVETSGTSVSRYAPYAFRPDARYSVGILRSPGVAKISAMRNPWLDFPSVHLGRIFERRGGGGHRRVGSLYLKGSDAQRASEVLQEIVGEIRRAPVCDDPDGGEGLE